jgi:hypothetical protein
MTIKIELSPQTEAGLAALAAELGLTLPDYLQRLLEEKVPAGEAATLSPGERARLWRESAKGLPHTPSLSDEAVSRESIYDVRASTRTQS